MYAADLVVIDYTFTDETVLVTDTMPRWFADYQLFLLGVYDRQPVAGKRVAIALLIQREAQVH